MIDSLLRNVGVADAVCAGADGGVGQEAAVVVGVGPVLAGQVNLLNHLLHTAQVTPSH